MAFISSFIGFACSKTETRIIETTPPAEVGPSTVISEKAYCSNVLNYPNGATIEGLANFKIRRTGSCGAGLLCEEYPAGADTGYPIRYAEIQILDSNGNIVQCGETTNDGTYSIVVPANTNLTINVNSRADNSHVNVSVLDSPYTNNHYSLSTSFTSGATGSITTLPTLTGMAKNELIGAAFNIYNNILRANEAMREYLCGNQDTSCSAFSVAPKANAYWIKGFNPIVYFGGSSGSGVSFYVPGTSSLYILGGINNAVDTADTDHFDDAVISHEYGHFMEDNFSVSDSPGGYHDASAIRDARLVWSEGWASFFSSIVRKNRYYTDTVGNVDGSASYWFNYNIESNSPSRDNPTATGEGNFREFAITRALWDAADPVVTEGFNGTGEDDNSTDNFNGATAITDIWNAFISMTDSNDHFRSMGLAMSRAPNSLSTSQSVTFHRMINTIFDYGWPLPTTGGACASITITANDTFTKSGQCNSVAPRWCSNQFSSNDFYKVTYDGSFSTITLSHISGPATLRMRLYNEDYTYYNDNDSTSSAEDIVRQSSLVTSGSTTTINLSGLPFGIYMLNIKVHMTNDTNPGATQYDLLVNGVKVCP